LLKNQAFICERLAAKTTNTHTHRKRPSQQALNNTGTPE